MIPGEEQGPGVLCPGCKTTVHGLVFQCPKCGTDLVESQRAVLKPSPQPAPEARAGARPGIILFGVLASAALAWQFLGSGKGPVLTRWRAAFPPFSGSLLGRAASLAGIKGAITVTPSSRIVVYGANGDPGLATLEESLKMRGLSSRLIAVSSFDDFANIGILDRLKEAGIMKSGNVTLPFFDVDGRLLSKSEFDAAFSRLPLKAVREQAGAYVVVYGPQDCPKTQRGMQELDANGFPYEYRDVNDQRYRPRFEALLTAYGIKSWDWPFLDVSGRGLPQPTIEEVRAAYR